MFGIFVWEVSIKLSYSTIWLLLYLFWREVISAKHVDYCFTYQGFFYSSWF